MMVMGYYISLIEENVKLDCITVVCSNTNIANLTPSSTHKDNINYFFSIPFNNIYNFNIKLYILRYPLNRYHRSFIPNNHYNIIIELLHKLHDLSLIFKFDESILLKNFSASDKPKHISWYSNNHVDSKASYNSLFKRDNNIDYAKFLSDCNEYKMMNTGKNIFKTTSYLFNYIISYILKRKLHSQESYNQNKPVRR